MVEKQRCFLALTKMERPAALSIPSLTKESSDLAWRLDLIRRKNLPNYNILCDSAKLATLGKLPPLKIAELVKIANSDKIILDEVEKSELYLTALLLSVDSMPDELVLQIDTNAMIMVGDTPIKKYITDFPMMVQLKRRDHKTLAHDFLNNFVPALRAKVAFREIVAAFAPDYLIPELVSFSTRYLGCPTVQNWLRAHQYNSRFGSTASSRDQSRKKLGMVARSIVGDPRTNKKRKYPYWKISKQYDELSSDIRELRKFSGEKRDFKPIVDHFCKTRKVPDRYRAFLKTTKMPHRQLALEIMTEQGAIDDPKAFKDFQAKVNKLRRKHDNMVEKIWVLQNLLDTPTFSPEIYTQTDPLSVLELVRI